MFLSCVVILVLCIVKILPQPPPTTPIRIPEPSGPTTLRPTTTANSNLQPTPDRTSRPPGFDDDPCRGDDCRKRADWIGPIIGSLCGLLVAVLIGVAIYWFCSRRKIQKSKTALPTAPPISFIERPPLYTEAISPSGSTARLYGASAPRNNSISSHNYEKIQYTEQP